MWTNMENKKLLTQTTDTGTERKTNPRTTTRKQQTELTDKEIEAINSVQKMLDQTLLDIMHDGKFTPREMCELLDPYIYMPNILSKICPNSEIQLKDRRHVNLKIMAATKRGNTTT